MTRASLAGDKSAGRMGLRYVSDTTPGITRRRRGKSFAYFDSTGRPVRDPRELARITGIVIPPAWSDVWICPARQRAPASGRAGCARP